MTRGILIARCMLAALGVYVLWKGLQCLDIPSGVHLSVWARVVSLILVIASCGYLVFKLAFDNAGWARRIADQAEGPVASDKWIAAGFRLALVFCGLLILTRETRFIARAVAFMVIGPGLIVKMILYRYVDEMFLMSAPQWVHLLVDIGTVTLGIYLVIGAPHYVGLQIKAVRPPSSQVKTGESG